MSSKQQSHSSQFHGAILRKYSEKYSVIFHICSETDMKNNQKVYMVKSVHDVVFKTPNLLFIS